MGQTFPRCLHDLSEVTQRAKGARKVGPRLPTWRFAATVRAKALMILCRVVRRAVRDDIDAADRLLWAIELDHPSIVRDRAAQIQRGCTVPYFARGRR